MRRELCLMILAGCIDGGVSSAGAGSTLDVPRILTVTTDPPEAAPGALVRLEAVIAPDTEALPSWSMCTTARTPIDNTAVSPECASVAQAPLGDGVAIDARIPSDACRNFGSETPAGSTPNPPDATGGYYQPVRVALGDEVTVARLRIQCRLAAAPIDSVRGFDMRYVRNDPPQLGSLETLVDGRSLALRIGISAPETYVRYDTTRGVLQDQTETQTVSWFVSSGHVSPELSLVNGTFAEAVWTPAAESTSADLWIIARDDRGATTYVRHTLRVAD